MKLILRVGFSDYQIFGIEHMYSTSQHLKAVLLVTGIFCTFSTIPDWQVTCCKDYYIKMFSMIRQARVVSMV
jgi:hypothetical protein